MTSQLLIKEDTMLFNKHSGKVTQCQNRSKKSLLARYLKNCLTNFSQTWQAHITVNACCIKKPGCERLKDMAVFNSMVKW